jgi:hypothetical protein
MGKDHKATKKAKRRARKRTRGKEIRRKDADLTVRLAENG